MQIPFPVVEILSQFCHSIVRFGTAFEALRSVVSQCLGNLFHVAAGTQFL